MPKTQNSFQNQRAAIDEMKQRQEPVTNIIAGNEITALPNTYAGWLDSELMCEIIQIPKGANVLDLCTGTGVIAVKAAQLGAKHVVGVDLNPEAVKSARINVNKLQLPQVEIVEGSLFEPITKEKFDVIIINPPYVDHKAADKTEISFWDEGNTVMKTFFEQYRSYLAKGGKVYIAWGDFADMGLLKNLADNDGAELTLLGSKTTPDGQETFLAYELQDR